MVDGVISLLCFSILSIKTSPLASVSGVLQTVVGMTSNSKGCMFKETLEEKFYYASVYLLMQGNPSTSVLPSVPGLYCLEYSFFFPFQNHIL